MQKIIPNLWFDTQAKEAAEFYVSIFPESIINSVTTLHDTPSGDSDILSFTLWGYELMAISAGPQFKINPSISFMVNFDPSKDSEAEKHLNELWAKLTEGGKILMEIDKYPFSERYGWVEDRFGVSWQLILTDPNGEVRPNIIPSLLFVGDVSGKAEEATNYYLSIFKNSKRGQLSRYPAGMEPDKEGTIQFSDFTLEDQWFVAMDSAHDHKFRFNEAISLMVNCEDQAEIDFLWEKLSAVPESEQCGWLKDKWGVSWQIIPAEMGTLMGTGTPEQLGRLTQALMPMHKIDLAKLREAFNNL